jgi:MoxR-like ATPase
VANYLHPGPLWWAFDWTSARAQARQVVQAGSGDPPDADGVDAPKDEPPQPDGGDPANGCLVLVDEIDKAETDVPNGLLEALGSGRFTPWGRHRPVETRGVPPLVIVTTNEERSLPDAFVRRCLVLHLRLPREPEPLAKRLAERGRAHFEGAEQAVLDRAAQLLVRERDKTRNAHLLPLPGQAEYLDLVRAVLDLKPGDPEAQLKILQQVGRFTLQKHPETAE